MKLNELKLFEKNLLDRMINSLKDGGEAVSKFISDYVSIIRNFYKYSDRNRMLILNQMPNAEYVTTVKGWNKRKRHVKKGETGIKIYQPVIKEIEKEVEVDMTPEEIEEYAIAHPEVPVDQLPKTKMVVQKEKMIVAIKPNSVFDIKQTVGEDFQYEKPKPKKNSDIYIAVKKLCQELGGINADIVEQLSVLSIVDKIAVLIRLAAEKILLNYTKATEINQLDVEVVKNLSLCALNLTGQDNVETTLLTWIALTADPVESLMNINKAVGKIIKAVYN
jgi:hypothetical protein